MSYEIENAKHIILNGYALDSVGLITVNEDGRLFEISLSVKPRDEQDVSFIVYTRDNQSEINGSPFSIVTDQGSLCGICIISINNELNEDSFSMQLTNQRGIAVSDGLFWV